MKKTEAIVLQAETNTGTMKSKTEPVLNYAVSLPQIVRQGRCGRRISQHYRFLRRRVDFMVRHPLFRLAEKHWKLCQSGGAPFVPYLLEMDYTASRNDGEFLSLHYDRYMTIDGQRRCVLRGADTWSLTTGAPVSCAHFFPGRERPNRFVLDEILNIARARTAMGTALFYEDLKKNFKRHFNVERFYLTDDGLSFFFQPGTIAPGEQGVPVFTIPKEKLGLFPSAIGEQPLKAAIS